MEAHMASTIINTQRYGKNAIKPNELVKKLS